MAFKRKYSRYMKKYRGKSSRGMRSKLRRRAFQARVRAAVMKTAETKYKIDYAENYGLYHDRGVSTAGALTTNQGALLFNPWFAITRGDTVSNRDGDEIYPRGMAVRIMYNGTPNRESQFVRIIVAVIPKVVSGTVMDGSNYDLLDAAGSNDTVTGFVKREGVKVLYDKTSTIMYNGSRAVPREGDARLFKKFYIKSKKGGKLSWQQDGTLANKPVGIWVIPYDTFGSLRTDLLGIVSFTCKLYFKDV